MNNRFYPDSWPIIPDEPTTDRFSIVHTESHGEGIVTKVPFKRGEKVFAFSGVVLPDQNLHTLQYRKGCYIYDPYAMGKVLHSCDPNLDCSMYTRSFIATRDIAAGEYLTMDYEQTEDYLARAFECQCGSVKCRGRIAGRRTH